MKVFPTLPSDNRMGLPRGPEDSGASPRQATTAWKDVQVSIFGRLPASNPDQEFWWRTTGLMFAILLEKAQYPEKDQFRYLYLYASAIIPELGAGADTDGMPRRWRSFMTDHFCPVEFSWEWNRHAEKPIIRFSFEPISAHAGTLSDPYNKHATLRFVQQHYAWIPGCDLLWFQHLWGCLVDFDPPVADKAFLEAAAITHDSRSFLALDLNEDSMVLKAYFVPVFRARNEKSSTMAVINTAISTLPGLTDEFWQSYAVFQEYLKSDPVGQTLSAEMVATDFLSPSKSRIKIYMRSPSTSLSSVKNIMSVGGRKNKESKGFEELTKLWNSVFVQNNEDAQLPTTNHRTGGILYYFEFNLQNTMPSTKVYLPVRHYANSDSDVALGLQGYVRSTNRVDHSPRYIEALESIVSMPTYLQPTRYQTYLTCALKGDQLRLTSYIAPVVYRAAPSREHA